MNAVAKRGAKPTRIGLIGLGRIGRLHAENLALRVPRARLEAVAEPNRRMARSLADRLHIQSVYETATSIFEDRSIDAVIICSPTDTHGALIEQAAQAGKHIFCEKPIAFDLRAADLALAAIEQAGVKCQIGFNRRFDPSFRRIREAIVAGRIGEPHVLRITSRDPHLPSMEYLRASGGLFFDMTIHDFDMARYLIGAEVESIYTIGAARIDPRIADDTDDIDTAIVTLEFTSDVLGTIDNSRQAVYGYDQRVEVFGSTGCLTAENDTPDHVTLSDATGVHSSLPFGFFVDRYREAYLLQLKEFVDCLQEGREPSVSATDGRAAVVMALAAKRSLAENRPVRLAEVESESLGERPE